MPAIIKFYLDEEPMLRNVPTWRCREQEHLGYVLDRLEELVVKVVHGSGGYGMLIGPQADRYTLSFPRQAQSQSQGLHRSTHACAFNLPDLCGRGRGPRHVDLRPFVLAGRDRVRIVPGGLTRVALSKGSLVVNSSQGGGTKDTWVLDE